jgi:hypothetical protein
VRSCLVSCAERGDVRPSVSGELRRTWRRAVAIMARKRDWKYASRGKNCCGSCERGKRHSSRRARSFVKVWSSNVLTWSPLFEKHACESPQVPSNFLFFLIYLIRKRFSYFLQNYFHMHVLFY